MSDCVFVYRYTYRDEKSDAYVMSLNYATFQAIREHSQHSIVLNTMKYVPSSAIVNGIYTPTREERSG